MSKAKKKVATPSNEELEQIKKAYTTVLEVINLGSYPPVSFGKAYAAAEFISNCLDELKSETK